MKTFKTFLKEFMYVKLDDLARKHHFSYSQKQEMQKQAETQASKWHIIDPLGHFEIDKYYADDFVEYIKDKA